MRKDWIRKPAALASALALMLALTACTDDDPTDTTSGVTDTTVSDLATTTTAAG
jgi:hypothetical protein